MNWTACAAILLAVSVSCGAFGAHALRTRLDTYSMGIYEKAVLYHFIHAIGILLIPVLGKVGLIEPRGVHRVCTLLFIGVLVFSGSLYALVLTDVRMLGAVTPIGGTAFIAGWLLLAWEALRRR